MTEFELIKNYFQRSVRNGDDAAIIDMPEGYSLVTSIDTSVEGCHFVKDADPADIGYKSLAVSISDIAAMGATPTACLLSLSLPTIKKEWLDAFSHGFFEAAQNHDIELIGGDTTQGPLVISTVLFGIVPKHRALTRFGAQTADNIYVTGFLGDAAAALHHKTLNQARLNRPTPRVNIGLAIRDFATSCIDISDGLAQDLRHILKASNKGAIIYVDTIPYHSTLHYALTGGDDYELCFTAPSRFDNEIADISAQVNLPITCIGKIDDSLILKLLDKDHQTMDINLSGYQHF